MQSIAKILGTAIAEVKELRLAVMASLRKLIAVASEPGGEEDLAELARFDKNYLPILFNVYTTKTFGSEEEGHRLAALETIKVTLILLFFQKKVISTCTTLLTILSQYLWRVQTVY